MNESERIRSLEERLNFVEKVLEKICTSSDVCGYKAQEDRPPEHHEETPFERFKRGFE